MGLSVKSVGHRRRFMTAVMSGALAAALRASAQSPDAPQPEDFDAAFREMKRNENLQFELPVPPPINQAEPSERPEWLKAIAEFFRGLFEIIAPALPYIFYSLLALGVCIILFFILRDVMGVKLPKRKPKVETEAVAAPLYQPSTEEARILLNTVDALAAEGKYAEAVHTLLFRSIQDIDLKCPNKIRKSLTSREIGDLDILTPHTRDAFSFIGRVVENSFFGGLPLGREDFQSCREAYEQFTVPKAWAA